LVVSIDGTNLLATSYGRDGKPGGEGLDCDLTSLNPKPAGSLLTFKQFLSERLARGMVITCFVCGGLTFLLSLVTVKLPASRTGWTAAILKIGVTIIAAAFVASMIAALHIPSGH
jgi:hypothetical protein